MEEKGEVGEQFWGTYLEENKERQHELEQRIQILQKDNQILRNQFNQALHISQQSSDLRVSNEQLMVHIRELRKENDELKNKNDLLVRSIDDMKQKATSEAQLYESSLQNQLNSLKSMNKSVKSDFKKKVESYETTIKELNSMNTQLNSQCNDTKIKTQQLLTNAAIYFHISFNSITELIAHLKHTEPPKDAPRINPNEKYILKCKRYKKTLRQCKNKIDNLEKEKNMLSHQVNERTTKLDTIIKDYQQKIIRIQDEHDSYKKEQSDQYHALENKLESVRSAYQLLQNQFSEARAKAVSIPTSPIRSQPERRINPVPLIPNSDMKEEFEELKVEKRDLISKVYSLKEDLSKAKEELLETHATAEKYKAEIIAIKHVRDEALAEAATLREALHKQVASKQREEKPQRDVSALIKMQQLERTVETQRQQLFETQLELERTKTALNEKSNAIKATAIEAENTNREIRKLNSRLLDAEANAAKVKENSHVALSSWNSCPSLDRNLSFDIAKIGEDESINISTRVSTVIRMIGDFYTRKVGNLEEENASIKSVNSSIATSLDSFLSDVYEATFGNPSPAQFDSGRANNVVKAISEMRAERDNLVLKSNTADALNSNLMQLFGTNNPDEIMAQVQNISIQNNERRKKIRALKSALSKTTTKLNDTANALTKAESEHKMFVDWRDAEVARYVDELEVSERKVKNLEGKLKIAQDQYEFSERTAEAARIEAEKNAQHIVAGVESQRIAEISSLRNQLEDAEYELQETTNNYERAQARIASLEKEIKEQDRLIAQSRKRAEEAERSATERNEREKAEITNAYETAIEELKAQTETTRSDFQKMSNENAALQKRLQEAKNAMYLAKKEKFRLEAELTAKNDELVRERKLLQTEKENAISEAISEVADREARKVEAVQNEKQDLISFVTRELSNHMNIDPTNGSGFREGIHEVATKLSAYERSNRAIRMLVHARPNQSTEDAVVQSMNEGKDFI